MNEAALGAIAGCCFAATALLGSVVARRNPTAFDVRCLRLRGRGTPFAVLCTRAGYWPALSAIAAVLFVVALVTRTSPAFVVALAAVQLLAQWAVDGIKAVFKRIRPDDWLFHQELGYSFPSGHSTTAVVFFGGLLVYVWHAPLPAFAQIALSMVAGAFIVCIPWSRTVLAAHYGTDVIAGMVFGAGWLCILAIALEQLQGIGLFGVFLS